MILDNIKNQTTWSDAAASINKNFEKLKSAIGSGTGGEGGSGLKYSEERTIYGIEGELTDEQRAYNVETFNKYINGESITVNIGGEFFILTENTDAGTGISFLELSAIIPISGIIVDATLRLYEDGSVEVSGMGMNPFILAYDDQEEVLTFLHSETYYARRVVIPYSLGLAAVDFISLPIPENDRTVVIMTATAGEHVMALKVDYNTGELIEHNEISIGGESKAIIVYPNETSERNKQAYEAISAAAANDTQFTVYALYGTILYLATAVMPPSETTFEKACVMSFSGWRQTEKHPDRVEKEFFEMMLYPDGRSVLTTTQDYVIDGVVSDTSTNPIQNKAIKAYVDSKIGTGGSIDPELLEAYMPLEREYSDEFNDDFAR